jgi:PAS domain S-box-containing protein
MVTDLQVLAEEYVAALRDYVDEGGEEPLDRAREIGLNVLDRGAAVSDLAQIASHAVGILLLAADPPEESVAIVRAASEFFAEAVSPLELTHEGFREALETLGGLNAVLERDVSTHLRSLREAQARLARVLALVGDAVLLVDGDRCIAAASRGAGRLLGGAAADLVGRRLAELLPTMGGDERPAAPDAEHVPGTAGGTGEAPRRLRGRRLDGSEVVVEATVSRLRQLDRDELVVVLAAGGDAKPE